MRRRILLPVLALAALVLPAATAPAVEIHETRGDFHYDREGNFVAVRHADAPAGTIREPKSFAQKFAEAGIQLPPTGRAQLEPRVVPAKTEVRLNRESRRDEVIVKFVEGRQVRMRAGRLVADGSSLPEVTAVLAGWTGVSIQPQFDTAERILDDNKRTGELISGRELADLNNYFRVRLAAPTERLADLANALLSLDIVETAYVRSRPQPAPACADVTPVTPLWEANQNYLGPAPAGMDAYYAWGYHAGGDGAGSENPLGFYVVDIEYDWCLNHEDLDVDAADALTGLSDGPFNTPDHGTAVLGSIAACDNSYGMTGMTPDVTLKLLDSHVHGVDHAVCVTQAVSFMFAGEVLLIEQQTSGPSAELLPVEWDSATWSAISVATANGIVVVEAAANGGVDLDDVAYAGWFSPGHDSGALLIGAANQGSHSRRASSDYGATVDLHGYGTAIYTTGYGNLFSPATDCSQDYTPGFSGTSGAAAMVTGAVAALQGIANAKYEIDLAPWQIRAALRTGGTPQGAPTGENIGPMPDLVNAINEIEPDLIPYAAPGWTDPFVPRSTPDATAGNCVLAAGALPGNTPGTYFNWTTQNNPSAWSPADVGWTSGVYLEDDQLYFGTSGPTPLVPGAWGWWGNVGPVFVRGGRHTLMSRQNDNGFIEEWIETNNDWWDQFIWSPQVMLPGVAYSNSPGPAAISQYYFFFNAEGLQASTGSQYWHVFAVMPANASDDFDIRLNTETPANVPTAGFGANVAASLTAPGEIAFVGFDKNEVLSGTYWASVLNFSGAGADWKLMDFEEDTGVLALGSHGPFAIGANDLVAVHELSLPVGMETRVHIEWLAGSADYGISVIDTNVGFFDKTLTMPGGYVDAQPSVRDEFAIVEPTESGFYGLVVWKKDSASAGLTLTYNVHVSTLPNLVSQKPGAAWYGPIVPRDAQDATVFAASLPAVLPGNVAQTSWNWSTYNEGANDVVTSFQNRLFVDDEWLWFNTAPGLSRGVYNLVINTGYNTIRGGRHHARLSPDALGAITEFSEIDNIHDEEFIWSPLALGDHVPVTRGPMEPSDPAGYYWFSCDGFRSPQGGTFWEGVAVMPVNPADEYGIRIHAPSTGSLNGFDAPLAADYGVPGVPSIALVNYNQVFWQDWDYGVLSLASATGDFVVQKSTGPLLPTVNGPLHEFGTFSLASGMILDLYEVYIAAPNVGVPLFLTLDILSGNADLTLAFFDGSGDFLTKGDATYLVNDAGAGGDEHVEINVPVETYYGIGVFKSDSGELANAAAYRLVFRTTDATGVDIPAVPTSFALAAPSPNPFAGQAAIRYDVPAGGANVRLDVYDLQGRRVATLAEGFSPAGRHSVRWDGRDTSGQRSAAGVYFVRFQTPEGDETRKITLLN